LREKLGDEGVDSLIELINQSQTDQKAEILEIVEEKFERRLSEEMGKLRQEMGELKAELINKMADNKVETNGLISELRTELHQSRADLIKWMFIFWIGQIGMILGILFAFFKK